MGGGVYFRINLFLRIHSFLHEVQFCKGDKIFDASPSPPFFRISLLRLMILMFGYIMKTYWQEDILDLGSISDTFIGEDESSGNHTNTY